MGREAELARLRDAWEKARIGARQVVLVAGEAGVGKTRLAAELATGLHREGAAVLLGRCDEELCLPYMPFVEALRQYLASGASTPTTPTTPWSPVSSKCYNAATSKVPRAVGT